MRGTTFCPKCGAEYLAGVVECADCHVPLGAPNAAGVPAPGIVERFRESAAAPDTNTQPDTDTQPDTESYTPSPAQPDDAPEGEEIVYDLSEWAQDQRVQLGRLLTGSGVVHRWEVGTDLVVLEADEAAAEQLMDEIEASMGVAPLPPTDADADDGDDEVTYAVMSDLFVAADRLQKDPADSAVAGEFYMAADAAAVTAAPFGIDVREWQQVQELAASLVAAMETAIDDDVLSRDAAALRAVLARYV